MQNMKDSELKIITDAVERKMEVIVNGKIAVVQNTVEAIRSILEKQNERANEFEKKMDLHIAEVEPYIRAGAGLKVLRGFLVWLAGGILAWIAIKNNFRL